MSRAHMKDEAFRAVIDYENKVGVPSRRIVGPYATHGAAKGQGTVERGKIEHWGGGKVTKVRVQRATGWEDVE